MEALLIANREDSSAVRRMLSALDVNCEIEASQGLLQEPPADRVSRTKRALGKHARSSMEHKLHGGSAAKHCHT